MFGMFIVLHVVTVHWLIDCMASFFSKDSPSFKKRCRGWLEKSVDACANTILFPQTFRQKVGVLHLLQLSDWQTDKWPRTTTQKPVNILWKSQCLPVSLKPWLRCFVLFFFTFMQLDTGVEESVNLFCPHRLPLVCPPLFLRPPHLEVWFVSPPAHTCHHWLGTICSQRND